MKTCGQCGFHHQDADVTCMRCGAPLEGFDPRDPLAPPRRRMVQVRIDQPPAGCADRLAWLGPLGRGLHRIGRVLAFPLPEGVTRRNPWLAGALSLVPGVGQLYNRQPGKAALFFALLMTLGACCLFTFYHPISNVLSVGFLLIVLYAFHDGLTTALRINGHEPIWQSAVAYYCAWVFYVSSMALGAQWLAHRFVMDLYHISDDVMAPYLRRGERVGVDCWTYRWREPRVGEVVFYDPPKLAFERPITEDNMTMPGQGDSASARVRNIMARNQFSTNWMLVDPKNMIERIVAGPGQTFERRDGVFYRDGAPVPLHEQPIVQAGLPARFRIAAPPGQYVILFSYTGDAFEIASMQPGWVAKLPSVGGDDGWIPSRWDQSCTVARQAIRGPVRFVYNPPPARRWLAQSASK